MTLKTFKYIIVSVLFLLCLTFANSKEIWERTGALGTQTDGTVRSIGVASNGHLFACIFNGAPAYRSTNNGTTWQTSSSLPSNNYIYSFATKDTMMFAASDENGVFRTTNNGATWTKPSTALIGKFAKDVIVLPSGTLLAGTYGDGIFRSDDNGITWNAINTGLSNLRINALAALSDSIVIAASDGEGLYITKDKGNTWEVGSNEVRLNYVHSLAVSKLGHIYAGTDNYGIFRAEDTTLVWNRVATEILSKVNTIVISPKNIIYAGTSQDGMFYSSDEAVSWLKDNDGFENNIVSIFSIIITPDGDVFAGTNGGGVYKKTIVNGVDDQNNLPVNFNYIISNKNGITLSFNTTTTSSVRCTLYSVLGEKIAVLCNDTFVGGGHTITVSESPDFPLSTINGVYYCVLETPYFSCTKPIYILN